LRYIAGYAGIAPPPLQRGRASLFSFTALLPLLIVVAGGLITGHLAPPDPDEGTGAHVFQLSIAALLPTGLVFLTTADWTRPARLAWRLAAPAVFVVAAFALLYYYEHVAAF
jgi:hypothetical protein